jgi:hypothetical protein
VSIIGSTQFNCISANFVNSQFSGLKDKARTVEQKRKRNFLKDLTKEEPAYVEGKITFHKLITFQKQEMPLKKQKESKQKETKKKRRKFYKPKNDKMCILHFAIEEKIRKNFTDEDKKLTFINVFLFRKDLAINTLINGYRLLLSTYFILLKRYVIGL